MNRRGHDEQTWFTFSYSPVRDVDGSVAGMFCACWETTQKFRAEQALHEANQTLERRVDEAVAERKVLADIVDAADTIVQMLDLQGRWLAFNRAAREALRRVYGIEPQLGHSLFDALAHVPEQQVAVRALWQRALDGEEFVEVAAFGAPGARDPQLRDQVQHPARPRRRRRRRLPVRDRRHRAAERAGAAAPGRGRPAACAEARIARPAHRRRGARLQQPAAGDPQRRQPDRDARRCGVEPADARRHAPRGQARHRPHPPPARVLAPAAGASGPARPAAASPGHARDADALAARRPAGRDALRRRPVAGGGGCRRARARGAEPAGQRTRRDARRRNDRDSRRQRAAGGRGRTGRRLRAPLHRRLGRRHVARGAGARLRSVLHDQGNRQGLGTRPGPGLRLRHPGGRRGADREQPGARHDRDPAPAAHPSRARPARARGVGGGAPARSADACRGGCFSWRTIPRSRR